MSSATPGQFVTGLIVVLGVALVLLFFSMNRHLKKINFKEDSDSK